MLAGRGSRWGVFCARLEDIPGTVLHLLLDFLSLCPREVRSWLEMPPGRMQKLGTRFQPTPWGFVAGAGFILPQK